MATAPFGAVLEAALKDDRQGGKLIASTGETVDPNFFCCLSGTSVGVAKDPVALMGVSPRRFCTNTAVTVTYGASWSPSSTILTWAVTWGDGQTSGGAWAGAPGSVAHPLGGYVLPGTYTITLTVTDMLGAVGTQSATVEAIDCAAVEIDLFAGCGLSGVWGTTSAGSAWTEVGGLVEGLQIHDLKANLFTIGLATVELWAATENGLFKGQHDTLSGTTEWEHLDITPIPYIYVALGIPFTMQTLALTPSKYCEEEFYLLGYDNIAGTEYVWLFRTGDGGVTWTHVQIGGCDATMVGTANTESIIYGGNTASYPRVTEYGNDVYELDTDNGLLATRIAVRNDIAQTWSAIGGMVAMSQHAILAGDGSPYRLWVSGFQAALATGVTLQAWNGGAWVSIDTPFVGMGSMARDPATGYIYVATRGNILIPFNASVRVYDSFGNFVVDYETPGAHPNDSIDGIAIYNGELFIYVDNSVGIPPDGIYRHLVGDTWALEHATTTNVYLLIEHDGILYGQKRGTNWPLLVRDDNAQTWQDDIYQLPFGEAHQSAVVYDGDLYVGTDEGKIFRRDEREGYMFVASVSCDETVNVLCQLEGINNHDSDWLAACFYDPGGLNQSRLFRLPGPTSGAIYVPSDGRHHIMDMSADGMYVFIGLMNGDDDPFIVKMLYDLSEHATVYDPGAGTWPGVACDPWYSNIIWIFGDFGAANKVRLSDDWGESWTNETEGTWGAGELVRPLLISDWDTLDVIVVLNAALEVWRTPDSGVTWTNIGTPAFAVQCGARDPYEPENVWIGRTAAGANHLQYSPNAGINWVERSAGITANAPITAIEVTG